MSFVAHELLKNKPIGLIALKPTDALVVDKKNGLLYCVGFILAQTEQDEPEDRHLPSDLPDDFLTQFKQNNGKRLRSHQPHPLKKSRDTGGTAKLFCSSQDSKRGKYSMETHLTDKQPDLTETNNRERQHGTGKLKKHASFSSQAKIVACVSSGPTFNDIDTHDILAEQLKDVPTVTFPSISQKTKDVDSEKSLQTLPSDCLDRHADSIAQLTTTVSDLSKRIERLEKRELPSNVAATISERNCVLPPSALTSSTTRAHAETSASSIDIKALSTQIQPLVSTPKEHPVKSHSNVSITTATITNHPIKSVGPSSVPIVTAKSPPSQPHSVEAKVRSMGQSGDMCVHADTKDTLTSGSSISRPIAFPVLPLPGPAAQPRSTITAPVSVQIASSTNVTADSGHSQRIPALTTNDKLQASNHSALSLVFSQPTGSAQPSVPLTKVFAPSTVRQAEHITTETQILSQQIPVSVVQSLHNRSLVHTPAEQDLSDSKWAATVASLPAQFEPPSQVPSTTELPALHQFHVEASKPADKAPQAVTSSLPVYDTVSQDLSDSRQNSTLRSQLDRIKHLTCTPAKQDSFSSEIVPTIVSQSSEDEPLIENSVEQDLSGSKWARAPASRPTHIEPIIHPSTPTGINPINLHQIRSQICTNTDKKSKITTPIIPIPGIGSEGLSSSRWAEPATSKIQNNSTSSKKAISSASRNTSTPRPSEHTDKITKAKTTTTNRRNLQSPGLLMIQKLDREKAEQHITHQASSPQECIHLSRQMQNKQSDNKFDKKILVSGMSGSRWANKLDRKKEGCLRGSRWAN